jgi:hypothetical protein
MNVDVFYGEDLVRMDKDTLTLKRSYSTVRTFEELPELAQLRNELLTDNLFTEKKLFVFRNMFLFQVTRGKLSQKIEEIMQFLSSVRETADMVFVDEDSNKIKYYKLYFPKATYHDYKLPGYLFAYLDNLKPGNIRKCFEYFQKSIATSPVEILFFMTKRRIKELLQLSSGELKGNYQPWMLGKLKSQAKEWNADKLVQFYSSLFNSEKLIKTGKTPYTTQQSLEIILSLYL